MTRRPHRRPISSIQRDALGCAWLTLAAAWVLLLAGCSVDAVAGNQARLVSTALDNGTVKIGIDLGAGGSISYLSRSDSSYNLVNVYDKGRYVQQSYYTGQNLDRTSEGQDSMWSPWPWNPIQSGDTYGHRSRVVAWSNDGHTIYVRTRPLLWDMNGETCQCHFETWITLEGQAVHVRNKLTSFRTDSRWSVATRAQELPAVYAIGDLYRVLTYTGRQPFRRDSLTRIRNTPSFWEGWDGTEHWAACVNGQNFGFAVYSPPRTVFAGGLHGSPGGREEDSSTCYLAPLEAVSLAKTSIYDYDYYLTVGTLGEMRHDIYELDRRLPAGRTSEETWGFNVDGNFRGWATSASVARERVVSGSLEGTDANNDPFVVSPTIGKSASSLNKVVVQLRNDTSSTRAQLFFQTLASGYWSRSKSTSVAIQPHSDFARYTFDMSSIPDWRGTITKLRLDPVAAAGSFGIDWVHIGAGA
jgi:hypothetical protein